jgi:N utilization substance protein B
MNRTKAREQAFIICFERSINKDSVSEIIDSAETSEDVRIDEFAEKLALGVEQNEALLDETIAKYIRGWTMGRLSKVSLAVLRLALFEMRFEAEIPVSVSINEAVELAKKYGGADDAPFVNGVLGSAAKETGEKESCEKKPGEKDV